MPLAFAAPAAGTYRIVLISGAPFAGGDINAKGQVAFTQETPEGFQARFFDGMSVRTIPGLGGPSSFAVALNDHGQVTGHSLIGPDSQVTHAFFWSQRTGTIDVHGSGQRDVESTAADINNKGQVVGTAGNSAFRWSRTTGLQPYVGLGLSSNAFAINEAGTVVGAALALDDFGDPMDIPVRWTAPDSILALHDLGSRVSGARDINAAGHIVGSAPFQPNPFGAEKAFLWTPQQGIAELFPGSEGFSSANRINDKGMIIGLYPTVTGAGRGFIFTRETGTIPVSEPGTPSSALDLNNRGQVVGSINDRAYVWTRQGGFVDLTSRVTEGAPADLVLFSAVGIAENGHILASSNIGVVVVIPTGTAAGQPPVPGPITLNGTPRVGQTLSFHANFKDVDLRDTHTASWTWGDGGQDAGTVSEKNGSGSVSGQHLFRKAGIYTVTLTITDSSGKSVRIQRKVVICAAGVAIAGQGQFLSPPGALKAEPGQSGLAQLAFLSTPGSNARQASIEFSAPGLVFQSVQIGALMVRGSQFQYQGSGKVNGKAGYQFALTATANPDGEDRVRMRIWRLDGASRKEVVVYDNLPAGAGEGASIGRGAITVQTN